MMTSSGRRNLGTRNMLVRLAKPDECDALTALAMRAKASWGYPDDFMCACQPELTMTHAKIAAWTVWVAQSDQTIRGMIALNPRILHLSLHREFFDAIARYLLLAA
jgi:hypothetical protein